MRVIDSHLHLWQRRPGLYGWLSPELGSLDDDFDAGQAEAELTEASVDGVVLVQADDSLEDSHYMFAAASHHDWVLGVVAWLPLDHARKAQRLLATWREQPTFCGVRQLVHNDPRPDFYSLPQVNQTAALLADVNIPLDIPDAWPRDLAQIVDFASRHPELVVVVDHLGKPPIDSGELAEWASVFRQLGERSNTVVKFSGLHHPDRHFTPHDAHHLWELSLEVFGPARMMVGSNWPISVAYGGYQPTWSVLQGFMLSLSDTERALVQSGTARSVYGTSQRLATMTEKE